MGRRPLTILILLGYLGPATGAWNALHNAAPLPHAGCAPSAAIHAAGDDDEHGDGTPPRHDPDRCAVCAQLVLLKHTQVEAAPAAICIDLDLCAPVIVARAQWNAVFVPGEISARAPPALSS